jgi:hypothetical protein
LNWQAIIQEQDNSFLTIRLSAGGQLLSWNDVITSWTKDAAFRDFYNQLLVDLPYGAFFWEHPPVTRMLLEEIYEFSVFPAPYLAGVKVDGAPFKPFFTLETAVVSFDNLRPDAHLLVPCPVGPPTAYAHLADFVRQAPPEQINVFWQRLGSLLQERLDQEKCYLNTSGLGVHWLHIRLDQKPKYYNSKAYRVL